MVHDKYSLFYNSWANTLHTHTHERAHFRAESRVESEQRNKTHAHHVQYDMMSMRYIVRSVDLVPTNDRKDMDSLFLFLRPPSMVPLECRDKTVHIDIADVHSLTLAHIRAVCRSRYFCFSVLFVGVVGVRQSCYKHLRGAALENRNDALAHIKSEKIFLWPIFLW